eukprot:scaffold56381_cov20-Tisochrysis_lutea.AAC.3
MGNNKQASKLAQHTPSMFAMASLPVPRAQFLHFTPYKQQSKHFLLHNPPKTLHQQCKRVQTLQIPLSSGTTPVCKQPLFVKCHAYPVKLSCLHSEKLAAPICCMSLGVTPIQRKPACCTNMLHELRCEG